MVFFLFFFFSSRRRHTRSLCDWSSDVCSSDLDQRRSVPSQVTIRPELALQAGGQLVEACIGLAVPGRPIGPWSRRPGAPEASATRRFGLELVLVLVLFLGLALVGLGDGGGWEADAELGLDLLLDLAGQLGVVAEEVAGVLAALAELVAVVGEPGPRLLDQADVHADIQQAALLGDPLAVDDIELGRAERRGQLVLDHLGPGPVADHLRTVLQRLDPAHVEADRGVELQRPPPRGGLGRPEEDTYFLP